MEPRSIHYATDRWLTDSRVYGLIWMGRWLERADAIARVLNVAAVLAVQRDNGMESFREILATTMAAWGVNVDDDVDVAQLLLTGHSASSLYHCMYMARSNATQVASLELIQALSEIVTVLEQAIPGIDNPRALQVLMESVLGSLNNVAQIIDDCWFHQERLSEEEMYRRFVQQQ